MYSNDIFLRNVYSMFQLIFCHRSDVVRSVSLALENYVTMLYYDAFYAYYSLLTVLSAVYILSFLSVCCLFVIIALFT